jgi:hypothetical protein
MRPSSRGAHSKCFNVENRVRVALRAGKESLLDQQESP